MEVSDVRVRLVEDTNDRLKAVCSITLDEEFVVRDVKVVEGANGLFVAMPSRKLSAPCPKCRFQNHLRARYCNECGGKLPTPHIPCDANGREKVHRDIAHPITAPFRQKMQECILEAFREACEEVPDAKTTPDDQTERCDTEEREHGREESSVSEYDALIADLKPGDQRSDARGGREPRGDRGQRPQGGPRKPRGRREDKPKRYLRDEAPVLTEPKPEPKAQPKPEPAAQSTPRPKAEPRREPSKKELDRRDDNGDLPFGAGLDDSATESTTDTRSAPRRDVEPATKDRVDLSEEVKKIDTGDNPDDSVPFGAGLL